MLGNYNQKFIVIFCFEVQAKKPECIITVVVELKKIYNKVLRFKILEIAQ